MATSGIRRKVDDLGRVVIPAQIRRTLGIREGDAVEVTLEGERIVLARPRDACVFCGREDDDLLRFRNRLVCRDCVRGVGAIDERARASLDDPWASLATPARPPHAPPRAPSSPPGPDPTEAAPSSGRVPQQVVDRRGVVDGDAWARARREPQPSEGAAPLSSEPASPRPEPPAPPADDPASTTAW